MTTTHTGAGTDAVLRAIADERRREVLQELRGDGTTTVDQLVATLGTVSPSPGSSVPTHDALAVELHHSHLPVLAEADIIEYDRDRRRIRRGDQFEQAQSLITIIGE